MKIATAIALVIASAAPAEARVLPAWTASPQRIWGPEFLFPTNIPRKLDRVAVRQIVRLGIGGRDVRIVLSNTYGTRAVTFAGAYFAPSLGGSRIDSAKNHLIRFGGSTGVMLAPGASIVSDPVPVNVEAGSDIAVTLRFSEAPNVESFHWDGKRTGYVLSGDQSTAAAPTVADQTTARLFISGVLVDTPDGRGTVVVLGDSITDGAGATLDAEVRWPDLLAARAAPLGIAVANAGISGARLLSDGMGDNALARFDRDVLAQPGIRTTIVMLGINDIAWPGTPFDPHSPMPTFEDLKAGYRAIVSRAHANGVRVIGATLTPFAGALAGTPLAASYYSPAKDALRRRINEWIRVSGTFDAVVDFDRILADTRKPERLATAFDSGDHLHPGDAGNKAMADAIALDSLIGGSK